MRLAPVACVAAASMALSAQNTTIRTTVPLVVLPASVTDKAGHAIYGLGPDDFVVLDNGARRAIHVDTSDSGLAPVELVVAIQTTTFSTAALAKIQKVGAMIPEAVVGENGEAAVLTFDDHVNLVQDFTKNVNAIEDAFKQLKGSDGTHARMLDAVGMALDMLAKQPGARRRSILVIGETRDRGSESKLQDIVAKTQRVGVTIYTLNYSAWLTPFTAKPEDYSPPDTGLAEGFVQLARLGKKNTAEALTQATGGRRIRFETQSKLENDLIALGADIHSRYLISFTPEQDPHPSFHKLQVLLKDRPDVVIKARPGYWASVGEAQ